MKLAVTINAFPNGGGPIIFTDGQVENNVKTMVKYGYTGADLFIAGVPKETILDYRRIFEDNGAKVATLFAIFLGQSGVNLAETDPEKAKKNKELFKAQLDNAVLIGAEGLGLGYIRGNYGKEETEADALKRIAESLVELGAYAKSIGTNILLEPINRYEINTLNNGYTTVDFIKNNGIEGVKLCLDLFHMNIEDRSIEGTIQHAKGMIGGMHTPDSNRYAVGDGHFDFPSIVNTLKSVDYDGFLTLEAFTKGTQEDIERTLRQSAEILLPLL